MHYIAIIPDNLDDIEAIRSDYDPLTKLVPAHITLVFPFECRDLTAVEKHVRTVAEETAPFGVRLREFTGQDGQLIFLNVKQGNDPLIELHDRLYQGVLAEYHQRCLTYVPHMTVGRIDRKQQWLEALGALSTHTLDRVIKVTNLALVEVKTNGDRTVKQIDLGNKGGC